MENTVSRSNERSLKCLSLGESAYSMLRTLAQEAGVSASAYNRQLIQRTYKRSKNKLAEEVSTD